MSSPALSIPRPPAPSRRAGAPSYADMAARSSARGYSSAYLAMLLDPFDPEKMVRFPDCTLRPTALAHLLARRTVVVSPSMAANGAATCLAINPTTARVYSQVESADIMGARLLSTGASTQAYQIAALGTIGTFSDIGSAVSPLSSTGWSTTGSGFQQAYGSLGGDYGTRHVTYASLSAEDRTVACGIRVKCLGLPASQFSYNGRLYFIWVPLSLLPVTTTIASPSAEVWWVTNSQENLGGLPVRTFTEDTCISAVETGRGFSVTLAEVAERGGVIMPMVPSGPTDFMFRSTDVARCSNRWNWGWTCGASGVPAAPAAYATTPYAHSPVTSDGPGYLVMCAFGLADGTTLGVDYAHVMEYVPETVASAIVETHVATEPSSVRDDILSRAGRVFGEIAGSTTVRDLGRILGDTASSVGTAALRFGGGAAATAAGLAVARHARPALADRS